MQVSAPVVAHDLLRTDLGRIGCFMPLSVVALYRRSTTVPNPGNVRSTIFYLKCRPARRHGQSAGAKLSCSPRSKSSKPSGSSHSNHVAILPLAPQPGKFSGGTVPLSPTPPSWQPTWRGCRRTSRKPTSKVLSSVGLLHWRCLQEGRRNRRGDGQHRQEVSDERERFGARFRADAHWLAQLIECLEDGLDDLSPAFFLLCKLLEQTHAGSL